MIILDLMNVRWSKVLLSRCFRVLGCILCLLLLGGRSEYIPRDHAPNQLIVKFASISDVERDQILNEYDAQIIDTFSSSGAHLIMFGRTLNDDELNERARELEERPEIQYVEANMVRHLIGSKKMPNDPKFNEQYALHNTGGPYTTEDSDMDVLEAWDITTGSRNVVVGVVDSGMDYLHKDLSAALWRNLGEMGTDAAGRDKSSNRIDDDGNGYVDDWRGWDFVNGDNDPMDDRDHGSHCSGIIGASGNDGIGITGVNWNVTMMPLKAFNSNGEGYVAAIIKAIEYATKMGVVVTNNSYGSEGGPSNAEKAAIEQAQKKGILFIAAAGNSTSDNDENPVYPASYTLDNIITVASTDGDDKLSDFSNFGAKSVHVGAPGSSIVSTVRGNKYETWGGTSMAAPQVAGVVALIKAKYPSLSSAMIKKSIIETTDRLPTLQGKTLTEGRVNAYRALLKAGQFH